MSPNREIAKYNVFMTPGLYAKFTTTEGPFTIRLFEKETPKTVANFVGLAEGTKEWKDPVTRAGITKPFYDRFTPALSVRDFALRPAGADLRGTLDLVAVCRP